MPGSSQLSWINYISTNTDLQPHPIHLSQNPWLEISIWTNQGDHCPNSKDAHWEPLVKVGLLA
jgi:hypothetical protein